MLVCSKGSTWTVADTPIVRGTSGSGIFSIAMIDSKRGVIVGGNYEKPAETVSNIAFTADGGRTWSLGKGMSGYRSAVAFIDAKTMIAVGTNGTDVLFFDTNQTYKKIGSENLNSVASKGPRSVWGVGPSGLVMRVDLTSLK
jgi:hypothetical protein